MGLADWVLICFCCVIIIDFVFLFIYCRVQKVIDKKIRQGRNLQGQDYKISSKKDNKYIIKKLYRWINSYCYGLMRYTNLCVGRIPSYRVRRLIYKYIFNMQVTKKSVIHGGCEFRSPWNIKLGNCVIAANCILDGRNGITVADNVVFGTGVHVWTEEHDVNDPNFGISKEGKQPVIIEERAWICSDSTLLPGVKITEGGVIASRACVTKSTESYTIYGGVPAKKIGDRNNKIHYELSGKCYFHFF